MRRREGAGRDPSRTQASVPVVAEAVEVDASGGECGGAGRETCVGRVVATAAGGLLRREEDRVRWGELADGSGLVGLACESAAVRAALVGLGEPGPAAAKAGKAPNTASSSAWRDRAYGQLLACKTAMPESCHGSPVLCRFGDGGSCELARLVAIPESQR